MPLASTTLVDRLGLDLGLADPAPVAAAAASQLGARLVRVRFSLAGHTSADPAFLAAAQTSASAIASRGLKLLAVLDRDLTVAPGGMGALEDGPPSALATAWTTELLRNAEALAQAIAPHAAAFELLPAPNVRGPGRIAPSRWASLLRSLGDTLRRVAPNATLVSGGMLSDEDDDGVDYLRAVYHAAGEAGWIPGAPPFDVLGIELRVLSDGGPSEQTVSTAIADRVRRLWRVREQFEGTGVAVAGGVLVTRVGWEALRVGEAAQARNVWTSLNTLSSDPIVRGVIWASLADSPENTSGLFRSQNLAADDRRPSWRAFNDFVEYARQITPIPMASVLGLGSAAEPVPAPAPSPEPSPIPEPIPIPEPAPEPSPIPGPIPIPEPAPAPAPEPELALEPMPAPIQEPAPEWAPTVESAESDETPYASGAVAEARPPDEIDALIDRLAPPLSLPEAAEAITPPSEPAGAFESAPAEPEAHDLGDTIHDVLEAGEERLESLAEDASEAVQGWWQAASSRIWPPPAPPADEPAAVAEPVPTPDLGGEMPPAAEAEGATAAASAAELPAASPAPPVPEVDEFEIQVPSVNELLLAAGVPAEHVEGAIAWLAASHGDAARLAPGHYTVQIPREASLPASEESEQAGSAPDADLPAPSTPAPSTPIDSEAAESVSADGAVQEGVSQVSLLEAGPTDDSAGEQVKPLDLSALTNQQIINAIYRAGQSSWGLFDRCGLSFSDLALRRTESYSGPDFLAEGGSLTEEERQAIDRELRAS